MPKTKNDKKLEAVNALILRCKICNQRKQGKLVPGEGSSQAKVVFVGEAPGKNEIKTGEPFIGRAGKVLRTAIDSIGLPDTDLFITSAVKYLPIGYVTPKPVDIEHGRKHLTAQLEILKPKLVVVLGNTAAQSLLNQKFIMSKDHGKVFEIKGQKYFLSYHPAAVLYSSRLRPDFEKDFFKIKKLI